MNNHQKLVADLKDLLSLAEQRAFHDFDSHFDTPKVELVRRLEALAEKTRNGDYDN